MANGRVPCSGRNGRRAVSAQLFGMTGSGIAWQADLWRTWVESGNPAGCPAVTVLNEEIQMPVCKGAQSRGVQSGCRPVPVMIGLPRPRRTSLRVQIAGDFAVVDRSLGTNRRMPACGGGGGFGTGESEHPALCRGFSNLGDTVPTAEPIWAVRRV
jgi:hypothetical protein